MDKEELKDIILNQRIFEFKTVPRTLFRVIKEFEKTPFIIIISGVRRSGKSTLLNELRTEKTYYVNFDDERYVDFTIKDFQSLYEILIELYGKRDIFLFDEIQNIPGWERFVRRLHNERKKVYVSGSNATMLSRKLGTHLTGRHISFSLYPFSFSEYLNYRDLEKSPQTRKEMSLIKNAFNDYLSLGGFPEFLQTGKEEYLKSVYENVLYRDIITRFKLPYEKPIKEVAIYVASNIGKELSFNTLKKLTGLTSTTTIKEYFGYLENSYLIFLINRYSYSLKKQVYYNKKAYIIDAGIASVLGFRTSRDAGRILENTVFLALRRRYEEIYFHKEKKECDFLIRDKGAIIKAIQVTMNLSEINREREIAGLKEAMKIHKLKTGLILTDNQEETIVDGKFKIFVVPVWKWLLEKDS